MRILVRSTLVAVFCLMLLLTYVSTTRHGLQLAWQLVQPRLPAGLSIEKLEGRLIGPLAVTELHLRSDEFGLDLASAELAWSPSRLLFGTLQVERLSLDDVRILPGANPAPPGGQPPVLPERIALPVALEVGQLAVRRLVITGAAGSETFSLERGDASLSWRATALEIRHLSVASDRFQAQLSGRLGTVADFPLQAELGWRLDPPDYAEIQGRTLVSGTLKRLLVKQTFNAPYLLSGEFTVTGLPDDPGLAARVSVNGLDLQAINAGLPALRLSGDISADGPVHRLALNGALDIDAEPLPALRASIVAQVSAERVEFETLRLESPVHGTEVRISGPVEFGSEAPDFDLRADWTGARWPLDGAAQVESPSGELHLRGSPDAYRLDSRLSLTAPGYPDADLSLGGGGNLQALQLADVGIATLGGHVRGRAAIGWHPRFSADIEASGESLDPGLVVSGWPGKLAAQLQGRVEFPPAGPVAEVSHLRVKGQLRDLPVRLETRGDYRNETLSIADLRLVSGPSALQLSGAFGERLDIDWTLDSQDLATLLPAASGRLSGKGYIGGTRTLPAGSMALEGSDLRFRADRIGELKLDAAIDMSAATVSQLDLRVGAGQIRGIGINTVTLSADGIPAQHTLRLAADSSLVKGRMQAKGQWQQDVWHFELLAAELAHGVFAPWVLDGTLRGSLGRDRLAAERACWHSGAARLCLGGAVSGGTRNGEFELRDLPLDYFASLLPDEAVTQGTLALDGRISQQAGRPATTQLGLDSNALALRFPAESDRPEIRIAARNANLTLHGKDTSTRLDGDINLDNGATLSLQATVSGTDPDFLNRPLRGQLSIEIPDIAFIDSFSSQISDAAGALRGNLRAGGNLRTPVLQGAISTGDARLTLEQPGITLEQVRMKLAGRPDGDLAMDLSARSGEGQLTIKGEGRLLSGTRQARFSVTGRDFLVVDTREASITASPDLRMKVNGRQLDIEGQVEVPRASIRPRKLPESSVSVSPDQVIVRGDEETAVAGGYQVSSRVRFILGEQVRFDGFGLRGRISGDLIATDRPGKPTTANGELAIHDGRYRAYGQNLDIRTGRLLFAGGPVSAPALDVEAVRRPAPDILVGVRARGNIRRPEFSLFSEPGMSQSDQLSWLVLGRPLESDASSQEKNSINQAAIMLGMGGGLALTEEYSEKLGIDEISIESSPDDPDNQASLLVGKYLTPKLFVSYGVGIFEPVSTLRFRYALGSKWRLVGESSAVRSSTDLFYVIELGK